MIDEKQIKEWVAANVQADLTCKVMPNSTREGLAHDGSPCPCLSCYAVRLRVERRDLAQIVLQEQLAANQSAERAEKAERELHNAGLGWNEATKQRDALAAALVEIQFGNRGRCPVCAGWNCSPCGETDGKHTKDCPIAVALDANAPGWRGPQVSGRREK